MEKRVKMHIEATTESGDTYSLSQEVALFPSIGNDFIDEFSQFINNFLRVCGYVNFNKNMVILESVDEDEWQIAVDAIRDYRDNNKEV